LFRKSPHILSYPELLTYAERYDIIILSEIMNKGQLNLSSALINFSRHESSLKYLQCILYITLISTLIHK